MIGQQIRKIRTERGLTQLYLARQLHCEQATISMYERNMRDVDPDTIVKLKHIFNCEYAELLEG